MLRKSSWKVFLMILGFAATMQAFAAQGGDRNGSMVQAADSANAVDLQGVVDSITMGFGQGTPSFALSVPGRGVVTIYVGSYRAWTATNFELKTGMSVTVRAFQSAVHPDGFVAGEIRDDASGATVQLLSARGRGPGSGRAWAAGQGGPPCGRAGAQVNLAAKTSLEGSVADVNMGYGQGFPSFTLRTGEGDVTIVASPYRVLADAGFAVNAGDKMSVLAFPSNRYEGAYVAAELKNLTTGKVLVLRDDQGFPVGVPGQGGGRGRGSCWRVN
jgi:hypothetical protein